MGYDTSLINDIFQILNPDNTMTFNRFIAHAIGTKETIILFALISKMNYYRSRNMLDADGFFYATALDIQESTTFTQRQQESAIANLVEQGLIETVRKGIPAKKYFRISMDIELFRVIIAKGEAIAKALRSGQKPEKPLNNQFRQNVETRDDEMSKQESTKCENRTQQNVETGFDKMSKHTYKSKRNNLKENNPHHINQNGGDDRIDETDFYRDIIFENIDLEAMAEQSPSESAMINEIAEIMTDVVCSEKPTIRVNGENKPQGIVKSVFLKLNSEHIRFVIERMKEASGDIKNIRNYLITALYNSYSTIDSYYSAKVSRDMKKRSEGG